MYLPEHFKSEDWDQMVTLIEDFSFGLLISIVENNLELKSDVKDMVRRDVKAQLLVGNELKQD